MKIELTKGDVIGGFSAAALTLPMSIGYGITAFSSLGNDFLPIAAVIGINAVIISGLFTAFFSGTPTLISGPSGPITVVLITIIAELQDTLAPYLNLQNNYSLVLGSVALCLIVGGLLQVLLGYFRIGTLIKYIPYPVVSGFINGIAIALILHQLPNLLGIDIVYSLQDVIRLLHLTNPTTLLIGFITLGSVFIARRFFPALSPPLFGLIVGAVVNYGILAVSASAASCRVIGEINFEMAKTSFSNVALGAFDFQLIVPVLPDVLFFGLVLCLISSVETLTCSAAMGYRSGDRYDSNKDLLGQGIGNAATALVSVLPSSGSLVRSISNLNSGGRTRWSGIMCSSLILLVFIAASKYIGLIPLAALSGVIITVGLTLFDWSEFNLFFTSFRANKFDRDIGFNLLISLTVTTLTVAVDLILAIVVGIVITTASFVFKTGKSVVRRKYRCNQIHSKTIRNMQHTRYLEENGSKILVIELQGPLFFGSAEEVAKEIDASIGGAEYIIMNMKHVSEIDITGTKYLLQIHNLLKKQSKTLLISHIWEKSRLWDMLIYGEVIGIIGKDNFFSDIDRALEYAEDQVLCGGPCEMSDREYTLTEMDIVTGFSKSEIQIVEAGLQLETYQNGDMIIREGDEDRDLFLLSYGMVSVSLQLQSKRGMRRLNAINPGVGFGEIAMLDHKPRSASILAEGDVKVFRLPYNNFIDLMEKEPAVANKLILNMALILSTRLRLSTEEIKVLIDN